MNCRKVNSLLSAYMDGELTGEEQMQVREHLRHCRSCSEEHESLLFTKRLVARLSVQEPHPELESRILARLAQSDASPASRLHLVEWWAMLAPPQRYRLRLAALSAALAVLSGVAVVNPLGRSVSLQAIPANIQPSLTASYAPAPVQRYRDYMAVHNPYNWDDTTPQNSGATIAPAGSFDLPVSALDNPSPFSGR